VRCHRFIPNGFWARAFQFDTTADGRTIKMLNVIAEFTHEALAVDLDRSIDADGVVDVLDPWPSSTGLRTTCVSTTVPNS
jgi:putative transposase